QPYFVTSHDDQPLVFAGLWDECMFGDAPLASCAIITTESKAQLKELHTRMPVMLSVDAARQWLSSGEGKELLLDQCLTDFKVYKVDKRVNNSRQEGEELITPV
ncbi:MAG: SOS response-associated peptidase family protein, partial [Proteobacteria bacterium]|nr:SOS response-associated peptidase family protein [Pseudomonadota bacterium]